MLLFYPKPFHFIMSVFITKSVSLIGFDLGLNEQAAHLITAFPLVLTGRLTVCKFVIHSVHFILTGNVATCSKALECHCQFDFTNTAKRFIFCSHKGVLGPVLLFSRCEQLLHFLCPLLCDVSINSSSRRLNVSGVS